VGDVERLPFTILVGLSVTIDVDSQLGLVPKDSGGGGGGVGANLELTDQGQSDKLDDGVGGDGSVISSDINFTNGGKSVLEGELEVGRLGELTSVSALESVLSLIISRILNTHVEAVTSTETGGHHGRLEDSERILGVSGGSIGGTRYLLSLTDDIGISSVVGDFVRKSPGDLNGVDDLEDLGTNGSNSSSIDNGTDTAVGEVVITKTGVGSSSNHTVRSGVNTNTSGDLSGIVGVLTERHQTGGLSIGLSRWLGDWKETSELGGNGVDVVGSGVGEVGVDGGSRADLVGWHLDGDLELHFEGREVGRGQVLIDWDNEGVVNDRALGGSGLHGDSWDFVRGISIINTELGVSTGGDPSPVIVGDWVLDPGGGSGILNSGSTFTEGDNDVVWSFDDLGGSPSGHSEGPLDFGGLTWELFGGSTRGGDLGLSKSHSGSGGVSIDRVEDSVSIHNWTGGGEVVHPGRDGDWSPRTDDST